MQNYQNFQPYPIYPPTGYQPMQINPMQYQDRLNPTPQMQFSQQFSNLNGKVVESVENITASDVPMDGTFAVFPKKDISEVYVKYWTGDGKIATVTFQPVLAPQSSNLPSDQKQIGFEDLNDVLDRLTNKVDNLYTKLDEFLKPKAQKSKKEVSADE